MTKNWTWAACGYNLTSYSIEEMMHICLQAGFSGIEGAPPLFEGKSVSELQDIGKAFREAGLAIETFHLPFSTADDIASFYETRRRIAVDRMKSWIETAVCVGAKTVIQHPATRSYEVAVEGFEAFFKPMTKSLFELLPFAESRGISIALENMLPRDGSRFGSQAEHFQHFIKELAHPNLGFCLDTGHALIAFGAQGFDGFYELVGPSVKAFHLADNAGDRDSHLAPGRGNVPWRSFFRRTAELGYRNSMCIETPPFAPGPCYAVEAWIQMIRDMDALVERALAEESAADAG
jgi:sugar phosphate isomerase/epimerase